MTSLIQTDNEWLTAKQASDWASGFLQKNITPSNISYLVRYGRIKNKGNGVGIQVDKSELSRYYEQHYKRENAWKEKLGSDLNWRLSFSECKESDTTKHVHRLHPYKGKFIPQLVEYFLDDKTDEFKKEVFFHKNDIVLDPFCGSGTTLVQSAEMGINAIGVDISAFNAIISNSKLAMVSSIDLSQIIEKITLALKKFNAETKLLNFENELLSELYKFNSRYFLTAEAIDNIHAKGLGDDYGEEKAKEFLPTFFSLIEKYNIPIFAPTNKNFLTQWYHPHILTELDIIKKEIDKAEDKKIKEVLSIILCRTARTARATTHSDLATLIKPVSQTYYCAKHGKICKPLFSAQKWWQIYSKDTLARFNIFAKLRQPSQQHCLVGDSAKIDIINSLEKENPTLADMVKTKKINGIFSSPPYVGLIDYHEQHAYAYDLLQLPRADDSEIGPAFMGQGRQAKEAYVNGVSAVISNAKKYMVKDYNVFLVANDKFNLYPTIAEKAGMMIVNQYKRPVLNRTEKDRAAYAEFIFHLKEKE
ncbi:MAG: DNA methyltransferase [Hydrotalea sp.]|nr:DNA methyltransferase [Hydrotalea sp.]